jgi:quinoprotein glucose dehydrogenase
LKGTAWNLAAIAAVTCLVAQPTRGLGGQSAPADRGWPAYGGDLANTRYSPLDAITAANFSELEIAWRFRTDNLGPTPEYTLQSTPLVVNGVLYSTAGSRRAVVAIDASSGELLWTYREDEGERGLNAPRRQSGRGLAYWSGTGEARIVYVTPGYRLIALDAKTGLRVPGFGESGVVDLKTDFDQTIDLLTSDVGLAATPVIAEDTIIVGAAHGVGTSPPRMENVKGYVRAFDARTGRRLWTFHTIPKAGEFGYETWHDHSALRAGNAGVWTQMAVDEELDTVYLPVELPTGDFYGGHRPGPGLFGESLVAVDLHTGRRKWHYQLVHHGLWDSDVASPPILADIVADGRAVKAVVQPTKQGFLFVLDRVTGEPVWPIEERAVPKGDVPGEWYSPTQPFPTKPPPFERQGVSEDDLIDWTPALRAEALAFIRNYRIGPLFTPPSLADPRGTFGTLVLPGNQGGANWPGGAFDPETQMVYVFSKTQLASFGIVPGNPGQTDFPYSGRMGGGPPRGAGPAPAGAGRGRGGGGLTVQGLSIIKPPYGRITAFNLHTGEISWQVPHGDTPDNIRNHPALKGLTIPRTGQIGLIGTLVTKTLVIAGEPAFTTAGHPRGALLRAYDKASGADAGSVFMAAPQTGSPMTYRLNGRQYLVVAIGGAGTPGELVAYRLPR